MKITRKPFLGRLTKSRYADRVLRKVPLRTRVLIASEVEQWQRRRQTRSRLERRCCWPFAPQLPDDDIQLLEGVAIWRVVVLRGQCPSGLCS